MSINGFTAALSCMSVRLNSKICRTRILPVLTTWTAKVHFIMLLVIYERTSISAKYCKAGQNCDKTDFEIFSCLIKSWSPELAKIKNIQSVY